MKKLLLALFIAAPVLGFTQEQATVNVSTTINPTFTITKVDDLVFGNVQTGDAVSVDALTGDASNAGNNASRAVITSTATLPIAYSISGTAVSGTNVTLSNGGAITYIDPLGDLDDPANIESDTRGTITVSLSFAINEADPVAYTLGTSTGGADEEDNTLYIGGGFTAPSIITGFNSYSATITVSAVYF
jgi:hypothetical protein